MKINTEHESCFFGHSQLINVTDDDLMISNDIEHKITIVAGDNIANTNRKKTATLFRNLDKLRNNPNKIGVGEIYVPVEIECASRKALLIAYATKQKMGKALFTSPSNIQIQNHVVTCRSDKIIETQTTISMSDEPSYCPIDTPIIDGSDLLEGASLEIINAYRQHWEYYAYRAPLWKKRIDEHHGSPDHETKRILWDDDNLQEQFYEAYGYDTDELDSEIVKRCIAINKRRLTANEYCTMINAKKQQN
jgi:hypothetical protein